MTARRFLALGYGNPGREDDGLGPAAVARLEALGLPQVEVQDPYQLALEDAVDIAQHDVVWFIDAARKDYEPFAAHRLAPAQAIAFDSHSMSPQTLLAIVDKYYGKTPEAWMLGIRGYSFEFCIGLSEGARSNLDKAVAFLVDRLHEAGGARNGGETIVNEAKAEV